MDVLLLFSGRDSAVSAVQSRPASPAASANVLTCRGRNGLWQRHHAEAPITCQLEVDLHVFSSLLPSQRLTSPSMCNA